MEIIQLSQIDNVKREKKSILVACACAGYEGYCWGVLPTPPPSPTPVPTMSA